MPLRKQVVDLLGLFTEPRKRAARARRVVNCPGVIMAELDQNKIAPLHFTQDFVPEAFGHKRSAAASSARSVHNVDLLSVEVVDERIPPTARSVGIVVGRRIADHKDRGEVRIDRALFSRTRLLVDLRILSLSRRQKQQERDDN